MEYIGKFYTILYKYDKNQKEWYDLEMDYTPEEVEKELRRMRRSYPEMRFRKKCTYFGPIQRLSVARS
jgi:hypothetical protein